MRSNVFRLGGGVVLLALAVLGPLGCKTTDGIVVLDPQGARRMVTAEEVEQMSGETTDYLLQVGDQVSVSFRVREYQDGEEPWDYRIEVGDSMEVRLVAEMSKDRETYKIDVGDLVGISFLSNWPLNASKTVRPDGMITMPEVGDVQAAGQTPEELQAELSQLYRKTGIIEGDPKITVNVDFSNPDRLEAMSRDVTVRPDGKVRVPAIKRDVLIAGKTVPEASRVIQEAASEVLQNEPEVSLVVFPYINTALSAMNGVTTVRPDGKVAVARLGEVQAAGYSTRELREDLEARVEELTANDVDVSADIVTITGSRVYVGGEVSVAGVYPLAGAPTVLQSIMMARGPTNDARMNNVILIRRNPNGKPYVFKTNLNVAMKKGFTENDVALRPFDLVFVPKKMISRADLFVKQYIDDLVPFSNSLGVSMTYYMNPQEVESKSTNKNFSSGISLVPTSPLSSAGSLIPAITP